MPGFPHVPDKVDRKAAAPSGTLAWKGMFNGLSKSTRLVIAFASVYLVWGSTYVAIHVAGEHLPPPVVGAARSLTTATLIAFICLARGRSVRVPRDEAWKLGIVGLLFMSGNAMLLVWGETMVPSGFASLIIATIPIIIALLETGLGRLGRGGDALNKRGWAGTLLGTAGIAMLSWPSLHANHTMAGYSRPLAGVFALLGAAASFAIGSVLMRRLRLKTETFLATGWQVGIAGLFNLSLALSLCSFHRAVWTWHGVVAILYLSVFGSMVGLVAFNYMLRNAAVTKVATYAFVNPVIAVLFGILFLDERLEKTELLGMAVIVAAVALVVFSRVQRKKDIVVAEGNAGE